MIERDAERIELGGGWHFVEVAPDGWFIRMPNGEDHCHPFWTEDDARAFATAMRPPASVDAQRVAAALMSDEAVEAVGWVLCADAGGCGPQRCDETCSCFTTARAALQAAAKTIKETPHDK